MIDKLSNIDWERQFAKRLLKKLKENHTDYEWFTVFELAKSLKAKPARVRPYLDSLVQACRAVKYIPDKQNEPANYMYFDDNRIHLSASITFSNEYLDELEKMKYKLLSGVAVDSDELKEIRNKFISTIYRKERELRNLKSLVDNHELWDKNLLPLRDFSKDY